MFKECLVLALSVKSLFVLQNFAVARKSGNILYIEKTLKRPITGKLNGDSILGIFDILEVYKSIAILKGVICL